MGLQVIHIPVGYVEAVEPIGKARTTAKILDNDLVVDVSIYVDAGFAGESQRQ